LGGESAKDLLEEITEIVIEQQTNSLKKYSVILKRNWKPRIFFLINESKNNRDPNVCLLRIYFIEKVSRGVNDNYFETNLSKLSIVKGYQRPYLAVKINFKATTGK